MRWFYPLSSRMGSSRARLAVKALEHPFGMARLATSKPDVMHVQWLGAAEADRWLFRPRCPAVFTARHHSAPNGLEDTSPVLFDRFDRVVVPRTRPRPARDIRRPERRLRLIPHPVFRSEIDRRDDGHTALCLGLIRPYKGTEDAVEPFSAPTVRVCSSSATRACRSRVCSGRQGVAQNGTSGTSRTRSCGARCPRRRSRCFRTEPRSTSRERCCRCSGGSARDRLRRRRARRGRWPLRPAPSCPCRRCRGDDGALDRLVENPETLATARRGAERRETSSRGTHLPPHLELYRELV